MAGFHLFRLALRSGDDRRKNCLRAIRVFRVIRVRFAVCSPSSLPLRWREIRGIRGDRNDSTCGMCSRAPPPDLAVAEAPARYVSGRWEATIRDALKLLEDGKVSVTISITPVTPDRRS